MYKCPLIEQAETLEDDRCIEDMLSYPATFGCFGVWYDDSVVDVLLDVLDTLMYY